MGEVVPKHGPTDPVLGVKGLEREFSGVKALAGVDLELRSDEVLGLIGPNGSGKTTLINVVSGLLPPSAGSVAVAGVRTEGRAAHVVARLGVGRTFQQIRLFGTMSVRENVEIGALAHPRRRESLDRVDGVIDRLGLSAHSDRFASTLAYGTQRRVEIARALVSAPKILLLDEPAAGMNEQESDELLATIRAIPAKGDCAVLIVDHDLRLIMRLCERIQVLVEGRTVVTGTPTEVQRDQAVIDAYLGVAHKEIAEEAKQQVRREESA